MRQDHLEVVVAVLRPGALVGYHYEAISPNADGNFVIGVWHESRYGQPAPTMAELESALLEAWRNHKYWEMEHGGELAFWDAFDDIRGLAPIITAFDLMGVKKHKGEKLTPQEETIITNAGRMITNAKAKAVAVRDARTVDDLDKITF